MRRAALSIGLVVASVVVSLAAVEGVLWIVRPAVQYAYMPYWPHMSHFRRSDFLPMELRPNGRFRFNMPEFDTTIVTNELGLRSAPLDSKRPRILCLGDSFTFGSGVENHETYCARLEHLFGGAYQFVNAGFADGNAPDTYALWLHRYRPAIRPSRIIVEVFDNDYDDVMNNEWSVASPMGGGGDLPERITRPGFIVTPDGTYIRDGRVARLPVWMRALMKHSYLVAILRDRVLRDASAISNTGGDGVVASSVSTPAKGDDKFLAALDMMRREAGEGFIGFYVVRMRDRVDESPAERLVRRYAGEHGIEVFSNHADFNDGDYFKLDQHWNAAGHRKAAQYLYRELKRLGY